MKKMVAFLLVFPVLLTLTSCASNEPPSEPGASQEQAGTGSQVTTTPAAEIIELYGKTYSTDEAEYTECDEDGAITFALFSNIGFIGFADENGEILYQTVEPGQEICGAIVNENISMGFDYINGTWELTESDVRFTGALEFTGELTKTPDDGSGFPEPGTVTFTAMDSESGFMPYEYGDYDGKPEFWLDGYDPEADYPTLFNESDTISVKATFDYVRILKTERASGMNYATLVSIELIDKNE